MNQPDSTAVRTALWRAMHLQADPPPHIIVDDIGLKLVAPDDGWQRRPDMDAERTKSFRASILARARFIEDVVLSSGVDQYVLLGAGIDTFVQRHPDAHLRIFEVDRPEPQTWKRQRLMDLGLRAPKFVPVDFEAGDDWWRKLTAAGFDARKPTVVASTGVSMYLTAEANMATLRQVAALPAGSTFVMSFLLPLDMAEPHMRPLLEFAVKGAAASGTPFVSFFRPPEVLDMARTAGLREAHHVSAADLTQKYFAGRKDGLKPPLNAEELLVATT